MNENEIQNLLRELRDEPIPADSLARVRARVEERTRPRGFSLWWKAAIVVPLPVLSFFLLILARREPVPVPPKPQPAVQIATAPPVTRPRAARPSAPEPRHATQPAEVRIERQPAPAPMVRIETEDPDVVIMLIAE